MLDGQAARVVAVEHVVAPVGGDGGAGIGALFRGVAAVGELADVARAAVRAGDQHGQGPWLAAVPRSEEHTSELQSLMRISYDVFCLKQKTTKYQKYKS